jgi:uncharacterized protein YjbI with pentapeptide repeats
MPGASSERLRDDYARGRRDFRSCDPVEADRRGLLLDGADLRSARLMGANLRGARLAGADLRVRLCGRMSR